MSRASQQSPWAKPRSPEQERKIKREAVLRTAAQIFNEKGFHRTSLDEVAERLHITKGTLYYYIKSKDAILFDCVSIGLEMLQTAIDEAGRTGGTTLDKLVTAMRKYGEIVTMDFGMCLILVGEDPLPAESRKQLRRSKAALDREFRSLIEQGIGDGLLTPCDPKIAAFTVIGALSWLARWYRPDGPLSREETISQCIDMLLKGLVRAAGPAPATTAAAAAQD